MTSKHLAAFAAASTIALLASVLPAFAEDTRGTVEVKVRANAEVTAEGSNVCPRISQVSNVLQTRLAELRVKLDAHRDERKGKLAEMRVKHQENAVERRDDWNARWDKILLELQAKATTDADKAAIAQFKLEMKAAFDARKTAVDAANATFRAGIDKAVTDRKTAVQAAADGLRAAVKAAFDKAKADCAAGVAGATIKANLKASLDAAHVKYRTDMQAAEKVGANAKALAETRRAAIEKANTVFKAAAQKARDALKAKLKADATASATATQP